MLSTVGREAKSYIRACETIHALLATGDTLTRDDRSLIVFSCRELLSKLKAA